MNKISIIINGVRYDSIDRKDKMCCDNCDLIKECRNANEYSYSLGTTICGYLIDNGYFKKSTKNFEK